jgi:dihydroorotate dehydrogenase electron transfer subunit
MRPSDRERADPRIVKAVVIANELAGRDLYRLTLRVPADWGPPLPGQFVSITLEPDWLDHACGDTSGPLLRRPFGIAGYERYADHAAIEILYACLGRVTRRMVASTTGSVFNVLGPSGTSFPLDLAGHPIVAAGGRGVGPLLYLARELSTRRSFTLIYGARSANALIALPSLPNAQVRLATDDGTCGERGTVLDALASVAAAEGAHVFACGPHAMLRAVADFSAARRWPCWVALEEFFGCGLGLCGSCAVPAANPADAYERYLWVCRDGPVVDGARIDWSACAGESR